MVHWRTFLTCYYPTLKKLTHAYLVLGKRVQVGHTLLNILYICPEQDPKSVLLFITYNN